MKQQKDVVPEHDFPKGLARPAIRTLFGAGYTRLEQLAVIREADLLKLHGMDPKAIGLIRCALATRGYHLQSQNE